MKMPRIVASSLLSLALVSFGCDSAEQTSNQPVEPKSPTVLEVDGDPFLGKKPIEQGALNETTAHHNAFSQVSLMPKPPVEEAPYRNRRRMDLDQLNASLKTVSDGLEWAINGQNQFEVLASTLGKPDFNTITSEDLDPSAMFLKFLNDASRDICFQMVERDLQRTTSTRVLFKHATPEMTMVNNANAIEINLVYLLKRFHGMSSVASCDDCDEDTPNALGAELQQWVWLYQAAEHVSSSPVDAWRTVCVALINHPDFYMY